MSGISLRRIGFSVLNYCRYERTFVLPLRASACAGRPAVLRGGIWTRWLASDTKTEAGTASMGSNIEEEEAGASAAGDDGAVDTSAGTEPTVQELMAQIKAKRELTEKLTRQVVQVSVLHHPGEALQLVFASCKLGAGGVPH